MFFPTEWNLIYSPSPVLAFLHCQISFESLISLNDVGFWENTHVRVPTHWHCSPQMWVCEHDVSIRSRAFCTVTVISGEHHQSRHSVTGSLRVWSAFKTANSHLLLCLSQQPYGQTERTRTVSQKRTASASLPTHKHTNEQCRNELVLLTHSPWVSQFTRCLIKNDNQIHSHILSFAQLKSPV